MRGPAKATVCTLKYNVQRKEGWNEQGERSDLLVNRDGDDGIIGLVEK